MQNARRRPWFRSAVCIVLICSLCACAAKPAQNRVELEYPLSDAGPDVSAPPESKDDLKLQQTAVMGPDPSEFIVLYAAAAVYYATKARNVVLGTGYGIYTIFAKAPLFRRGKKLNVLKWPIQLEADTVKKSVRVSVHATRLLNGQPVKGLYYDSIPVQAAAEEQVLKAFRQSQLFSDVIPGNDADTPADLNADVTVTVISDWGVYTNCSRFSGGLIPGGTEEVYRVQTKLTDAAGKPAGEYSFEERPTYIRSLRLQTFTDPLEFNVLSTASVGKEILFDLNREVLFSVYSGNLVYPAPPTTEPAPMVEPVPVSPATTTKQPAEPAARPNPPAETGSSPASPASPGTPAIPAAPSTGEPGPDLSFLQIDMAEFPVGDQPGPTFPTPSMSRSRLVVQIPGIKKTLLDLKAEPKTREPPGVVRLDRTEVTVEQYGLCVKAGRCNPPDRQGTDCNYGRQDRLNHPVNCVALYQAEDFCKWSGRRLPTETEWQQAARGNDRRTYPWGSNDAACERAVFNPAAGGCESKGTAPVCSKPLGNTPEGICDLAGNVREWTSDLYYGEEFEARGSPVIRGGSWKTTLTDRLHTDFPDHGDSTFRGDESVGFRCALTPPKVDPPPKTGLIPTTGPAPKAEPGPAEDSSSQKPYYECKEFNSCIENIYKHFNHNNDHEYHNSGVYN